MRVRKSSCRKSTKTPTKSIVQHLAQVLAKVQEIQKVKGDEFAYLRILDIANAVRDELLSRGILLVPSDVNWWSEAWTNPDGRVVTQCGVETEFELTDGHVSKRWKSFGMAQDVDGFALATAQTMAIKAWLKRVGLIFGEWDDPEREQRSIDRPAFPREVSRIAEYQHRALDAAIHEAGLTKAQAEKVLSKRFEQTVTIEAIAQLPKKQFDLALQILFGQRDMTADLSKSVDAAKNGKPQPVVAVIDRRNGDDTIAGD